MLVLDIGATEGFDDETGQFVIIPGTPLRLEHSLVSISKWESLHEKPFLSDTTHSSEETLSYIKVMCLDTNVPDELFFQVTDKDVLKVSQYIDAKMTATWFSDGPGPTSRNKEVITAEIIYYWLIALNIPFECQYWHLNRLLTLVKVCNQKNSPPKKMSLRDIGERNRQLNAQRKAQMNTNG